MIRNINRSVSQWLVLVFIIGLAGCTGLPVTTDYDTGRDFSSLKTYAWVTPKKPLMVDPLVDNDLMVGRIQRAVEAELTARGYVKADADQGADFFITYHVSAEDRINVTNFHSHYGYYPCWGCYPFGINHRHANDIHVRHYKQGTFMLDVIDPASEQLMWRGVAGKRLTSGTPQERDDYVRSIIGAILAEFPPGLIGVAS